MGDPSVLQQRLWVLVLWYVFWGCFLEFLGVFGCFLGGVYFFFVVLRFCEGVVGPFCDVHFLMPALPSLIHARSLLLFQQLDGTSSLPKCRKLSAKSLLQSCRAAWMKQIRPCSKRNTQMDLYKCAVVWTKKWTKERSLK